MSTCSSESVHCPHDAACEVLQRLWHQLDAKQAEFTEAFGEIMTAVQDSHMPDTSFNASLRTHRDALMTVIDKILDFDADQYQACTEE